MSTSQFDESKHRRAGDGKFTTKGFSEADGGVEAELSMPSAPGAFDVAEAWEQAGIDISHEASLGAVATMISLAEDEDSAVAAKAQEMAQRHIAGVVAFRDQLATDPVLAQVLLPELGWRDELERLSVAQGAHRWIQRYAEKHEVPVAEVVAELHRNEQTIAAEMTIVAKREGEDYDPRTIQWGQEYYGWQFRCSDAAKEVKNRAGYAQRTKDNAAQDIEWAKQGKVRCTRCGGVGGSKKWRDFVCYECGGAKCVEGKPEEIEAILNPPSEDEIAANRARLKAAEEKAEAELTAKIREYVGTDPALRALMDMDDATLDRSRFLSDMFERVNSGQQLTERQLAAVQRSVEKRSVTAQAKADAAPVPTGKGIEITGEVTSTKWDTDFRGNQVMKMRVQHSDGWAVWGTVPAKLETEVDRGSRISFIAEIAPSRDDSSFGFFKRPTKAKIVG